MLGHDAALFFKERKPCFRLFFTISSLGPCVYAYGGVCFPKKNKKKQIFTDILIFYTLMKFLITKCFHFSRHLYITFQAEIRWFFFCFSFLFENERFIIIRRIQLGKQEKILILQFLFFFNEVRRKTLH